MPVKHLFHCLLVGTLLLLSQSGRSALAQEADLKLVLPENLIESGFAKHLLPRFRFKTRIRVEPVREGEIGDASLAPNQESGTAIMTSLDGTAFLFQTLTEDPDKAEKSAKLLDWLQSGPGRAAIEGFQIDGEQAYQPGAAKVVQKIEVKVDGDASLGSKLALQHCGRCHVVDSRNPFGGIGSTPSFGAMKNLPNWLDRFSAFWTINPHPSFTQVEGITEPFDRSRPPPIAPLLLTLEEVEAITAFVVGMPRKDLGGAVEAR
ncbi:MAG: hypothetical protein ABJO09_15445 [Hyphomicrobiales bacterium]